MKLKTIRNLNDIKGKKILVRADLNVPAEKGVITDMTRMERFAPTAKMLADRGAKVVVVSHFGRPDGVDPDFSIAFMRAPLSGLLGRPVVFVEDVEILAAAADALKDGEVALLENIRFWPGEEANDSAFAAKLARGFDLYVNDAFSAAHRAHASTEGVARILPARAGLLMEEEIEALSRVLEAPARPSVAIVAGAKISTKISVLENLAKKVDTLLIGGAMANTFLLAEGAEIGASLAERDMQGTAKRILALGNIVLPVDAVVAAELKEGVPSRETSLDAVKPEDKILDIGPKSVALFNGIIDGAKTLVMNGPVGAFEVCPFDAATTALLRHIAERTRAGGLVSVGGGGDTVSALARAGVEDGFTYVSTAGGAFLEWLEGKTLPAIPPLMEE